MRDDRVGSAPHGRPRRTNVRNNPIEQGWQRFLDKLKELWGKLREPDPAMTLN